MAATGLCSTLVDFADRLPADLEPLWKAVHARLSSGRPVSRVRVGPLDLRQQAALADLLGQARLPGECPILSLGLLDNVLTESVGHSAREVVAELVRPVGDRAAEREQDRSARAELWSWLASHPQVAAQPALRSWAAEVRLAGLVGGSVARTRGLLADALDVLAKLPAEGVPLPVLADRVLGDSHGLDDGTRCARLVLRALTAIFAVPAPASAQERRLLWERAGVIEDELSAVVLAAGLSPAGDDIACRLLRACAESGHAAALTPGHLRVSELASGLPAEVWVFENPSVLALALDRFGPRCPPVVVTAGWPNCAAIALLSKLAAVGTTMHYHGDFDGEGIRIAAAVAARTGAVPWRMTSADYLEAVAEGTPVGRVTEAPWDPDLAGHLVRVGVTVFEERVATQLLDELQAGWAASLS